MTQTIPYPEAANGFPLFWKGGRFTPEHDIRAVLWLIGQTQGDVLEIGTAEGVSTLEIARTFPDRNVFTCDWPWALLSKEQQNEVPSFEHFAINCRDIKNVIPILKQSGKLPPCMFGSVSAIFIDGDHSEMGVRNDTGLALSILEANKGGVIIWHDYHERADWVGVKRFVDSIDMEGYQPFHIEGTEVAYMFVPVKP